MRRRCSGRLMMVFFLFFAISSMTKASPRRSTTLPVRPWKRGWGMPLWTLGFSVTATFVPGG